MSKHLGVYLASGSNRGLASEWCKGKPHKVYGPSTVDKLVKAIEDDAVEAVIIESVIALTAGEATDRLFRAAVDAELTIRTPDCDVSLADTLLRFAVRNHWFIQKRAVSELDEILLEEIADSQWRIEHRLKHMEWSWIQATADFKAEVASAAREAVPPSLSNKQRALLAAASRTKPMTGEELAERAGVEFNSDTKASLANLVRCQQLNKRRGGYVKLFDQVRTSQD